ncbi:hypothetical protein [Pedobacter sp. SL55]|uniref:hypothetical protein n=1 Tax=Pedobacter sp. SL55 TaxID=2995161 RepID=UPI00226FCCE1|nr:hypothetical protein [Pedobacter sp. SL55]WAC40131.1 hypothetical protein OVA16_16345 [Pedobacter sp. SL55]
MKSQNPHQLAYEQNKLAKEIWHQKNTVLVYQSKRENALWFVSVISLVTSCIINYLVCTGKISNTDFSSQLSYIFWMIAFIIAGNLLMIVLLWMHGKYLIMLSILPNQMIAVTSWSIWGKHQTKTYTKANFCGHVKSYDGKSNFYNIPSVNAPFVKIKTLQGKVFIVDLQGEFPQGMQTFLAIFKS